MKAVTLSRFRGSLCFSLLVALLIVALVTSECVADCLSCWQLKGVLVRLKDGTTIEGYATWNDVWADLGYSRSSDDSRASYQRPAMNKKQFPEVIFDPAAQIDVISVYTHLRSIEYPVKDALVATREPIRLSVKEILELKLKPGNHDGYDGAGHIPVVSSRIADLLQAKPIASCGYDASVADVYWVSYDKSFPAEELSRLCEQRISGEEIRNGLEARDIIKLYFSYD